MERVCIMVTCVLGGSSILGDLPFALQEKDP